jgi:hypothetical protein
VARGEEKVMDIDLRIPMGMMFSMSGAVLLAFGLATRAQTNLYAKSLGLNVNLLWGAVLLAFGLIVLNMGRRGQGRIEMQKAKDKGPGTQKAGTEKTGTEKTGTKGLRD